MDAATQVRGLDYRVDATIDGWPYAMGRQDGMYWRRTPAGVVRVIRSDVQGDDLDRWPLAVFGFDEKHCEAIGQANGGGAQWVLACRTAGEIPHWYYVDKTTGAIVREISRDGSRVVEYSFDDSGGWTITGSGGTATVTRLSTGPASVSADAVAIPDSTTQTFAIPGGRSDIPARFGFYISVTAKVNGHPLHFIVDTGTTQMLIDVGIAARLGLHPTLGHLVANSVAVGDATASNVPFQAVDLFDDSVVDGILGNEFFIGHVVHIDYKTPRLDFIASGDFFPPKGAVEIPLYADEGMPLVSASANGVPGTRFALDTGSESILLSDDYASQTGKGVSFNGAPAGSDLHFLEGWLTARTGQLNSFTFGGVNFKDSEIYVEVPRATNLDIPVDGILGSAFLQTFEWWLDYDHNRAWIRYRG